MKTNQGRSDNFCFSFSFVPGSFDIFLYVFLFKILKPNEIITLYIEQSIVMNTILEYEVCISVFRKSTPWLGQSGIM